MEEIWKDIEGYEGLYQVSNLGRVRNTQSGRVKHPSTKEYDYLFVCLHKAGKKKCHTVHRLVAQAFIPNQDNLPEVNHKDEDKANNCVGNLEWCTHQYNNNYGTRIERIRKSMYGKYLNRKDESKPVLCVETGEIFPSAKEVERWLGIKRSQAHISDCCLGKAKTAYGFHWQFINKEAT